jgi:hypothetical protein
LSEFAVAEQSDAKYPFKDNDDAYYRFCTFEMIDELYMVIVVCYCTVLQCINLNHSDHSIVWADMHGTSMYMRMSVLSLNSLTKCCTMITT